MQPSKRFIICKASAGAGKTFTLVCHFLTTALADPAEITTRYEKILAITFTNKAANEMKERIMKTLHGIVDGSLRDDDMARELCENLRIDIDELVKRCRQLESAILHNYSNLSVTTIDSFVYRLVRTFTYELRLPMNFNVLIDEREMVERCVDQLLTQAGADGAKELTEVLCAFVESRMEDGRSFHIANTLRKVAGEVLKEETPAFLDKLHKVPLGQYKHLYESLMGANRQLEDSLSLQARQVVESCTSAGLTAADFSYKEAGFYGFFLGFANGEMDGINKDSVRADNAAESGVLYNKTAPDYVKRQVESVTPMMVEAYRRMRKLIREERKFYNTRKMLLANLYGMAMLDSIRTIKELYYSENESVHISEFNKRIAQLVADEPAPFIYERVGNRYLSYLIDEFQDTSRLQFKNFLPLIVEALSRTDAGGLSSLIVGDGKQAIYRFRQGDVRQFMMLPQVADDPITSRMLSLNADIQERNMNYRTLHNIVNFNNHFFQWAITEHFKHNAELQDLYIGDPSRKEPALFQHTQKKGGYVQLSYTEEEHLLDELLALVLHLVNDLHYNYGDLLVLARTNITLSQIADKLVASINDPRFRLLTSESFILSNSRVVRLLQALLRYLENSADRVAALTVVSLYAEILDDVWNDADRDGGTPPNAARPSEVTLQRLRACNYDLQQFFGAVLPEGHVFNLDSLHALSLYDCCEELLRQLSLESEDATYVATFLNTVSSFMQRNYSDLSAFNSYLDENIDKLSSSTAPDEQALRLMTIHKSKGLEAPVVITMMKAEKERPSQLWIDLDATQQSVTADAASLPVALIGQQKNESLFSSNFDEEVIMTEMDRINLLYVALTRPREKLYVMCEECKAEGSDNRALLKQYATRNDSGFRALDDQHYALGEELPNPKATDAQSAEQQSVVPPIRNIVFPAWENRVVVAPQNAHSLSPLEEDSRRWGIVIHDLLAHMLTVDDVRPVVERYCTANLLDTSICDELVDRIVHMMEKEENKRFFGKGQRVLCEASLVVNGEVRRPDRIIFTDNATWVVDFKTGAYDKDTHQKYQKQVAAYVAAVSAMGYPNVSGSILYL